LPPLPDDAGAAVAALLARCHGALRGQLGSCTVELRAGDQEGPWRRLDLDGARMRVTQMSDNKKAVELLREDGAWRGDGENFVPLDAAERDALADLRELVRAAYLAPLYAPGAVARRGPTVFAVEDAAGATWRLEIDPARQVPWRLAGPAGEVRFLTFFSSGVSELPADVELGTRGKHHLKLVAAGVRFDAWVFRRPGATTAAHTPPPIRIVRGEPQVPEVMALAARPFLVLDDPGEWAARATRIAACYAALREQGQGEEGLPFFYEEQGAAKIGVPFAPAAEPGSPAFVARTGQVLARRPQQFALVLYRSGEPFADGHRAGARELLAHATKTKSAAAGPLRVIPHVDWAAGAPDAATLATVKLRFELPLQHAPK
jgi:hypothetical protein